VKVPRRFADSAVDAIVKRLGHLRLEGLKVVEHDRVLNTDQHQRLVLARGGAFQLHGIGHFFPFGARHPDRPGCYLLVLRMSHVQYAAGFEKAERIAVLVKHVRRNAFGRAGVDLVERLDLEAVAPDTHEQARRIDRLDGRLAAAFADLAGVPAQPRGAPFISA
jgi:hypothetical protein